MIRFHKRESIEIPENFSFWFVNVRGRETVIL